MANSKRPASSPFPSGAPSSAGPARGGTGASPFRSSPGQPAGPWGSPPSGPAKGGSGTPPFKPSNGPWNGNGNGNGGGQALSGSAKYGWHILQTVIVLAVTIGVTLLCGFLKETLTPSVLTDMLCYSLPAIAVLVTALVVENITDAMTPRFSRGAQILAMLIASALVIVLSLLSSVFYQQTFLPDLPSTANQPTPTPYVEPASQQIVFILDKSGSMYGNDDRQTINAMQRLLGEMTDDTQVGLVNFSDVILDTQPIRPLDAAQRQAIQASMAIEPYGQTDISLALDTALGLVEGNAALTQNKTKFLILTDGASGKNYADDLLTRMQAANVELYGIELYSSMDAALIDLVQWTKGSFVQLDSVDDLLESASQMIQTTPEPTAVPEPPAPEPYHFISESPVLWLVLLLLRGIIIGVTLSLMLSVLNQFRFQVILSPLCAFVIWLVPTLVVLEFPLSAMLDSLCGLVIMRRNQPR